MPRNVRNFWIEGRIDGRTSDFSGGPQSKDGGFSIVVRQRDKGDIVVAGRIEGRAINGKLFLVMSTPNGEQRIEVTTER